MLYKKLFPTLANKNWGEVTLNRAARRTFRDCTESPNALLEPEFFNQWLKLIHSQQCIEYSYGGWQEDREYLWRNSYLQEGFTTHLGVDYNVPPGTRVCLPKAGTLVMTEYFPDQNGGWGYRSIWKIGELYVIFAHLEFVFGRVGEEYDAGKPVGYVGMTEVNGNWFPHLHVQCMRSYNPMMDGYGAAHTGIDFPDPEKVLI